MPESTSGASPARDQSGFRSSSQGYGQERWEGGPDQPDQSKGKFGQLKDAAADKTRELAEDAKSLARRAKDSMKDMAHTAGEKVEQARTSVGENLEHFGSSVRDKGSSASAIVGSRLEAAGAYLRDHDFAAMGDSVREVVRRHPVQSLLVGVGLGFVLARAMSGRN